VNRRKRRKKEKKTKQEQQKLAVEFNKFYSELKVSEEERRENAEFLLAALRALPDDDWG
jgi:septal ring factor EnvC (AmiA/AmiB activator)